VRKRARIQAIPGSSRPDPKGTTAVIIGSILVGDQSVDAVQMRVV
jgi:hypothetical protein